MKRKLLLLPFFALFAGTQLLHAQYEEIRFPRSENEIARVKNFKIKKETENNTETGQEVPYAFNYYDAEGRIVRSINPEAKRNYVYNQQGLLTSRIDSIVEGRSTRVASYVFEYDGNNKLKAVILPGAKSVFTSVPADNMLIENLTYANGNTSFGFYKYDNEGKLREETWKNADSVIQKKRKIYLNKKNLAVAEVIITNNNGRLDSLSILRVFDVNDDIVKKTVNIVKDYKSDAAQAKESQTYVYTYDARGNRIAENCTSTSATNSFKNEWKYTAGGFMKDRVKYDSSGKPVKRFSYKYDLWN